MRTVCTVIMIAVLFAAGRAGAEEAALNTAQEKTGSLSRQEIPDFNKEAFIASAESGRVIELGIADCVTMALAHNSEIRITRMSPRIADAYVKIQRGRFEPDATFDLSIEQNIEQSSTPLYSLNPSKTKTGMFNFGYDQKLVTGTTLAVDFYNTRTRSNSQIQNMQPAFDSLAEVTITQPILKGFGLTVNKADLLIAKNNRLKSDQDFANDVIGILSEVKKSYYALLLRQEYYKTAASSLERIRSLNKIINERYAKGLASNVDLLQSEAELASANQVLLSAEAALRLSEDSLKLITNIIDNPELWNAALVLRDELGSEKKETDLVDSIQKAFRYRPDYESAKIDLRNRDITVAYTRNGMLPTVDLVGSYGLNGLDKVYEKDLAHLGKGKYPDWSYGVKVSIPLGSETEKGNYEKAKLEKKQALISFKRLEQKIILGVRDAVRNVDISYRMVEASRTSKEAQEEQYRAQVERFKAGLVSTHDIIDYQERLSRAEANFIKSVVDYNVSLIELAKAKGLTLIDDSIVVQEETHRSVMD